MANLGTDRVLEAVAIPAMLGIGALVAVQSEINGRLAGRLGSGMRAGTSAAVISFGTGLVMLGLICALAPGPRRGVAEIVRSLRSGRLRPWQALGGIAGASLVASQGLTVGTIGVALFTVAVVAGQTTSALAVDSRGLGPSGARPVTGRRALGAAVALLAVGTSVSGRLFGAEALSVAALGLAALPLVAGAATSWQQAVNGRVAVVGGPFAAALGNFVVGTATLLVLLCVSLVVPGRLVGMGDLPHEWWLYAGGAIGVVFIASAAVLVRVHGVLMLGLCTVAGQIVAAVAIDTVADHRAPGVWTVIGAALALVGVLLGATSRRRPDPPPGGEYIPAFDKRLPTGMSSYDSSSRPSGRLGAWIRRARHRG